MRKLKPLTCDCALPSSRRVVQIVLGHRVAFRSEFQRLDCRRCRIRMASHRRSTPFQDGFVNKECLDRCRSKSEDLELRALVRHSYGTGMLPRCVSRRRKGFRCPLSNQPSGFHFIRVFNPNCRSESPAPSPPFKNLFSSRFRLNTLAVGESGRR